MTWASFFKSHANAVVTGLGLSVGAGGSYAVALKMYSLCSSAATECLRKLGNNITVPKLTADIQYDDDNFTLTLENINIVIPKALLDMANTAADDAATLYCFYIPLVIGLTVTLAVSLSIGSNVALKIVRDEIVSLKLQGAANAAIINEDGEEDRHPLIIQ